MAFSVDERCGNYLQWFSFEPSDYRDYELISGPPFCLWIRKRARSVQKWTLSEDKKFSIEKDGKFLSKDSINFEKKNERWFLKIDFLLYDLFCQSLSLRWSLFFCLFREAPRPLRKRIQKKRFFCTFGSHVSLSTVQTRNTNKLESAPQNHEQQMSLDKD